MHHIFFPAIMIFQISDYNLNTAISATELLFCPHSQKVQKYKRGKKKKGFLQSVVWAHLMVLGINGT